MQSPPSLSPGRPGPGQRQAGSGAADAVGASVAATGTGGGATGGHSVGGVVAAVAATDVAVAGGGVCPVAGPGLGCSSLVFPCIRDPWLKMDSPVLLDVLQTILITW